MSAGPEHIEGCSMWHHQGGDYDRDCPACMRLAAIDQGKPIEEGTYVREVPWLAVARQSRS